MIKYSLPQVKSISKDLECSLPDDVINIINFIAHKVGAPTYKKTPNFRKKQRSVADKITGEDWAAIRNFKKTVMHKNTEGIMLAIDEIRSLLNKITDNSYDDVKHNIFDKIKESNDNFEFDEFMRIGKLIFEIGSMNKYCSHLYAKLYKELLESYEVFNDICESNCVEYSKIFENIRFVDSDVDYNLYCDYNKENENRRSMSLFFVNLVKYNVFDSKKIMNIINSLIVKVEEGVQEENETEVVEEIVSNLIILIEGTHTILCSISDWDNVLKHIETFSSAKKSDYKSLSTKTKFKYLDLMDSME